MIHPIYSYVLVKLLHRGEVKAGGIVLEIPDKEKRWQENSIEAEIVAKGPQAKDVDVGDVVVIEGHAGKWIDKDLTPDPSEIYRMIEQSDIIAIKETA